MQDQTSKESRSYQDKNDHEQIEKKKIQKLSPKNYPKAKKINIVKRPEAQKSPKYDPHKETLTHHAEQQVDFSKDNSDMQS